MTRPAIGFLALPILCSVPLAAVLAGQGVPDPINSRPCSEPIAGNRFGLHRLGVSPKNLTVDPVERYEYCYLLLDLNGLPIAGFPASQVALGFEDCIEPSTRPANEITADAASNANGEIYWRSSLSFGGSDPCGVWVRVMNMTFDLIPGHPGGGIRSPDGDGDGLVALVDLLHWQIAFVEQEPAYTGDLHQPFDDLIALADLLTWQRHFVAP